MQQNKVKKVMMAVISILCVLGMLPMNGIDIRAGETEEPMVVDCAGAMVLPASYEPDIETELPGIRNQNPYGNCWAFSATAMAEASILRQEGIKLDLSELQLAYFLYNSVADPLEGTQGDSNRLNSTDKNFMNMGGSVASTMNFYATWLGAVAETDAPYSWAEDAIANGLPDYLAYQSTAAHLRNGYVFERVGNEKAMKQAILELGAVQCSYYDKGEYYNEQYNSYYNTQYANGGATTNHAVVFVGWDDNFPKDHFASRAPGNGAWLVRNSWGNNGYAHYGYFWISYYDTSLANTVYAYDFVSYESDEFYDNNYQYDGAFSDVTYTFSKKETQSYANVFTAAYDREELKAVSFTSKAKNLDYMIEIYTNLEDEMDPYSGDLCTTAYGSTSVQGYHTVTLDEAVTLTKGTTFAVVVTLTGHEETPTIQTENSSGASSYIKCVCDAKPGQSFYLGTKGWQDLTTFKVGDKYINGNFRIKAFTNTIQKQEEKTTALSSCRVELAYDRADYTGKALTPTVRVFDGNTELVENRDYTVTYDNNKKIGLATVKVTAVKGSRYTGFKLSTFRISLGDPKDLVLTNTANGVRLTWERVTGATGYRIYIKIDGVNALLKVLDTNLPNYLDVDKHDFANGELYTYRVEAVRKEGNETYTSLYPNEKSICYLGADMGTDVENVSNGIMIRWTEVKNVDGYIILRSVNGGKYEELKNITNAKTTSYTDKTIQAGKKYAYKVSAYREDGRTTSYSADSGAVTTARATLTTSISKLAIGTKGVKITWKVNKKSLGYAIYRSTKGGAYKRIATISSAKTKSFTDTSARTNGTKYSYKVTCYEKVNGAKYEGIRSKAKSTYYVAKMAKPSAKSTTKGQITLKWKKNTKATGYQIYYVCGKTKKTITIKKAKTVSKVLKSLKKGKTYTIKIRAYKKVSKTTYYGAWSSSVKVKVKK